MGQRNRGQGGQKGDKKKEEKVKIRHYKAWNWPSNTKSNLLREANKADKKLRKLLARGEAHKPGGILEGSERQKRLDAHITRLERQARSI